ncbi:hypothetical protein M9991_16395 [Chryseobacterium gallinarum]|uniref:hypothetical protein n=1 Tax=Chryseobacterium gallinarum TaxID=1324352 RepID=UPI0020255704|nr:hypothetical protein [Chryseobacterium gallinarum]MCL8538448.1 hypothetical protein [Chryseobacterium gallinarum]
MKITILKSCHKTWDNMTAGEKGKFGSVCSKAVHDFTSFSDEEPINIFDPDKDIGGRFRKNKLGGSLTFSLTSKLVFGILIFIGFTALYSQETKPEIEKVQNVISTDPFNRNPSLKIGTPVLTPEKRPLVLLDDKKISIEELRAIKPESIETVNTFIAKEAIEKYGEDAKNGAIVFTTKKKGKRR